MKNKLFRSQISSIRYFNLTDTLFSGQNFSWNIHPLMNKYYSNVIHNNIVLLRESNNRVIEVLSSDNSISNTPINDYLHQYFSFDIDSNSIFSLKFITDFPDVWQMVKAYQSVRIIRQDPFEVMVTFMCAQGIGMHLIRRQVLMITERYGQKHVADTGHGLMTLYGFPAPSVLARADPDELALCTNNNRIRAANIIAMARSFESGKLSLACVGSGECDLETLRETLCAHGGIGLKIADCIALFGLGRFDAFPIDTHVKQYLWEWFGIEEARRSLTEKNYRILQEKARAILGAEYAGYAGHILFHCWRKEVKKMKAF